MLGLSPEVYIRRAAGVLTLLRQKGLALCFHALATG
jgi:hypothetical protein